MVLLCGACMKGDAAMHGLKGEAFKDERQGKVYMRRTKEGDYIIEPDRESILRRERIYQLRRNEDK